MCCFILLALSMTQAVVQFARDLFCYSQRIRTSISGSVLNTTVPMLRSTATSYSVVRHRMKMSSLGDGKVTSREQGMPPDVGAVTALLQDRALRFA